MTTKHLNGYFRYGYTLSAGYSKLVIDKTANVRGDGVSVPFFATVINRGTVFGSSQGVYLEAGGSLINGSAKNTSASITSYRYGDGVIAVGGVAIANFGTIAAGFEGDGVVVEAGGSLTNGSIYDTTALISGGHAGVYADFAAASIANFGTISGGVVLVAGGSLTNGSTQNTTALIQGYFGVDIGSAAATIANFGTIDAAGFGAQGVHMDAGGSLTNGSAQDTTALIIGDGFGVATETAAVTLTNFGTIDGLNFRSYGALIGGGGSLTNGSAQDTTALIRGVVGVRTAGLATIANFGTIDAYGYKSYGVIMTAGGSLTNGSAQDYIARISGEFGVKDLFTAATITNLGTIDVAGRYAEGVFFGASGSLTNGSTRDHIALIRGDFGVYAYSTATIANFGTIDGSASYGSGAVLHAGGSITNGSAQDTTALIYGEFGVSAFGGVATIVNFGTIDGVGGVSVALNGAGAELISEAGSTFIGSIQGGGGRLVLAGGGAGTISGLGGAGTLTGAVDASFSGFGSYEIAAGGAWTLAGRNVLNAADVLTDQGTLINRGALTIAGTVTVEASAVFRLVSGNISAGPSGAASIIDYGLVIKSPGTGVTSVGAHMFDRGVVEVASGTLDFTSQLFGTGVLKIDAGATLEADAAAASTLTATFNGGAATLALKTPNVFHATLSGFATGDIIDLLAIAATGASINGSDQLVIVNGSRTVATLQLSGDYIGATFTTGSDGHGGTKVELAPTDGVGRASVQGMAAAMAALAAPAGVAVLGHGLSQGLAPMLVNPYVHLQ